MTSVRILHQHEPPHGWWFTSPDLPGLTGSADTYAQARQRAEAASLFHLTCEAEEHGRPAPSSGDLTFEHFVPASEAPVLAA